VSPLILLIDYLEVKRPVGKVLIPTYTSGMRLTAEGLVLYKATMAALASQGYDPMIPAMITSGTQQNLQLLENIPKDGILKLSLPKLGPLQLF